MSFSFFASHHKDVNRLGLGPDCKTDGLKLRMNELYSLPNLPPRDMLLAFNAIADEARQEESSDMLMKFVDYIESTWFYSSKWRPRNINVYQRLVRSNNDLEGYHNRLINDAEVHLKNRFQYQI